MINWLLTRSCVCSSHNIPNPSFGRDRCSVCSVWNLIWFRRYCFCFCFREIFILILILSSFFVQLLWKMMLVMRQWMLHFLFGIRYSALRQLTFFPHILHFAFHFIRYKSHAQFCLRCVFSVLLYFQVLKWWTQCILVSLSSSMKYYMHKYIWYTHNIHFLSH